MNGPTEVDVDLTCALCGSALQRMYEGECDMKLEQKAVREKKLGGKPQIHIHARCVSCNPNGVMCITARVRTEAEA